MTQASFVSKFPGQIPYSQQRYLSAAHHCTCRIYTPRLRPGQSFSMSPDFARAGGHTWPSQLGQSPGLQPASVTRPQRGALGSLPAHPGIAAHETLNMLNQQGLGAEYSTLIASFGRGGILEREPLQRIGSALSSRYVLLPGLAEFNQVIIDRLSIYGWNIIQSWVTTLRLWLQLWETQTGKILWESSGEVTMATKLLRSEQTVPLDEIAQKLWLRMIQDNLLDGESGSRFIFSN